MKKAPLAVPFLMGHAKGYAPAGIPVGWMYPSFHATKMQTNRMIEKPTRSASARSMLADLRWSAWLPCGPRCLLPRIMKKRALAKLPMISTNANMTKYFMGRIIP